MSRELVAKIRVGLEEFAIVRQQFEPLIAISSDTTVGVIETSAASAMLHSFYTEIEKMLKLIAREWDRQLASSDSWHKDLLLQMSRATASEGRHYLSGCNGRIGSVHCFRRATGRGGLIARRAPCPQSRAGHDPRLSGRTSGS